MGVELYSIMRTVFSPGALRGSVLVLTVIAASSIFCCSKTFGIEREYNLNNTGIAVKSDDGVYLVRSLFADVRAEHIDEAKFHQLLKNKVFIKEDMNAGRYRVPKFIFFQIIAANMGSEPVKVESIELSTGGQTYRALTADEIKKRTPSPAYSLLNIDAIFSPRIIYSEEYGAAAVKYDEDTAGYEFDFISPGDTVLRIAAFDPVPVQHRDHVLKVTVTSSGLVKPVEFHLTREEYRTRGDDFRKKQERKP
jgi:hypothetical protein